MVDDDTGELCAMSMIHVIEEHEEEHFVKVFSDCVRAVFALFKTGYRVFVAVLQSCQKEKLTDGLANTVDLICFDGELNGDALGMTDRIFHNRLKELISKGFLKPKLPNQY